MRALTLASAVVIVLSACARTGAPSPAPSPSPTPTPQPWTPPPHIDEIARANDAFAFDLYRQIAPPTGNVFFSPNSISVCLSMTWAGARGDTATAMAKTLHYDLEPAVVHGALGALLRHLDGEGSARGYELHAANALWSQRGIAFQPAFHDTVTRDYGASLESVDFSADGGEPARTTINTWAEKQTHSKIHGIIPKGVITLDTRLVLANAIYFKGKWAHPFEKNATANAPFAVPGASAPPMVPMMRRTGAVRFAENAEAQVLEMPYVGDDLAMVVILPRRADGLTALEKNLDAERYTKLTAPLSPRKVAVELPRFRVDFDAKLRDPLTRMGMGVAFTEAADFSGITGAHDLSVSEVLHKAFVDVNEEGTEAAAVTAVVIGTDAVEPPPIPFKADHPFLFTIVERKTGTILFLGRITDPR